VRKTERETEAYTKTYKEIHKKEVEAYRERQFTTS
jgi:hypothetical protein